MATHPNTEITPSRPETTLPLFDAVIHSRRHDPETSKAAAERAGPTAITHCGIIRAALQNHGPMGKTRLAMVTGIDHIAIARRLADLKAANLAEPTEQTELSAAGRQERSWRAL